MIKKNEKFLFLKSSIIIFVFINVKHNFAKLNYIKSWFRLKPSHTDGS